MKVFHTLGIGSLSGKSAQSVFLPSGKQGMSYLRQYTYPKITDNNALRGKEMNNIKLMYFSALQQYLDELKIYTEGYKNLTVYGDGMTKRANGAFPVFVKLMYSLHAADPSHIDLATCTLEDIDLLLPDNNSIAAQVTNGHLPSVPGYELLGSEWTN